MCYSCFSSNFQKLNKYNYAKILSVLLYFWCPCTIKQNIPVMYHLQEFEGPLLIISVYSTYSAM